VPGQDLFLEALWMGARNLDNCTVLPFFFLLALWTTGPFLGLWRLELKGVELQKKKRNKIKGKEKKEKKKVHGHLLFAGVFFSFGEIFQR